MIRFKFRLAAATALALALGAQPSFAQANAADDDNEIVVIGQAQIGEFGLDLTGMDPSAKPGDDFERYASGAWFDRTEIPSDRPRVGGYVDLRDEVTENTQALIQEAPANSQQGAFYRSFMDERAVERAGIKPLLADLAKVRAISSKGEMARYMGQTYGSFGSSLFDSYLDVDPTNPKRYLLNLTQGGIGLPEKDYYFNPRFAPQRQAYYDYMRRTFRAIGTPDPAEAAARVMEFETYAAQLAWPIADRRNIDLTNNPYSSAELATYAPGFEWREFFAGLGVGEQGKLIANENTAIRDLASLFAATDLETLKLWEEFHVADQASPYLNKAMVDSRFAYTKTLSGVAELQPRWKRAVTATNNGLGEVIGQAFAAKYFPASYKAKMEAMIGNLKAAMADRIRANEWMAPATKQAALAKLENTLVQIGYPDSWRDYSQLQIAPNDLYGNVIRSARFNAAHELGKLARPVDRNEWFTEPQVVNAFNGGQLNLMVFPAAYLQPPHFDPAADDAVNYGAIGATIGHEIVHSFDDQGRKIDAEGLIRDWWTPQDSARFDALAKKYGAQFAEYEVVPGAFVNPELTMGENIADLVGLEVALDAYHRSLGGKEAPVLGGLTGDQRFFLSHAQSNRIKGTEDTWRNQVASDPHTPDRFRTIGPPRNMDAWYEAFNVQPGDAYYLAPEDRVHIW